MTHTDLRGVHGLIVDRLGHAIADGTLSGTIDPRQIAREYCVSRSVVRESLRALEAKGMVRARQRTGTVVTRVSEWTLTDPYVVAWRTAGGDRLAQLHDAIELRLALEPLGAELTAARGSAEAHGRLLEAAARIAMAAAACDVPGIIEADVVFHTSLLKGSGNGMLAQLALTVAACLRVTDIHRIERITADVAQRHEDVVMAITARDPAAAAQRARELVSYSRQLLDEAVSHVDMRSI